MSESYSESNCARCNELQKLGAQEAELGGAIQVHEGGANSDHFQLFICGDTWTKITNSYIYLQFLKDSLILWEICFFHSCLQLDDKINAKLWFHRVLPAGTPNHVMQIS